MKICILPPFLLYLCVSSIMCNRTRSQTDTPTSPPSSIEPTDKVQTTQTHLNSSTMPTFPSTSAPSQTSASIHEESVRSAQVCSTDQCGSMCRELANGQVQSSQLSLLFFGTLGVAIVLLAFTSIWWIPAIFRKNRNYPATSPKFHTPSVHPIETRNAHPENGLKLVEPLQSPATGSGVENGECAKKKKKKFDKNNPDNRRMHRQYMQAMKKQELSDADSRKFQKRPPIFMPAHVDAAQFAKKCRDPDGIIINEVVYDPSGNELYVIGTDVDDVELEPSSAEISSDDSQDRSTLNQAKTPTTPATQEKTGVRSKESSGIATSPPKQP